MNDTPNWLDGIGIASPCAADWNAMQGDDRCRFCSQCSLHVFDLSAMTRPQAEALVRERLGQPGQRLCVRFTRRTDGTVLTQDCPVGLRARLRRTGAKVAAAFAALLAFAGCRKPAPTETQPLQGEPMPIEAPTMGDVVPPPVKMGELKPPEPVEMGKIRTPTAPPGPSSPDKK